MMLVQIIIPTVTLIIIGIGFYADYRSRKSHREAMAQLTHKQPMLCRFCGAVWALKFDAEWNEDPANAAVREAMDAHRCGTNCDKCNGRGFIPMNGVEQTR
jgi:hypothetical protein